MRLVILVIVALAAACAREDDAPAEIIVSEVTASDELGGFTDPVTGAAFWTHPSLAFNSLMLIATESGLASYNIEDGNRIDRIEDASPSGLSVSYMGAGAAAKGVVVYFDRAQSAFALHTIDNIDRSFIPVAFEIAAPSDVNGYCLGPKGSDAGLALRIITSTGLETFELTLDGPKAIAAKTGAVASSEALVDCEVDALDGAAFAVTRSGKIYRYTENEEAAAPFAIAGADAVTQIGVALGGLTTDEGEAADSDNGACCGQIALLDSETGQVHLFDRDDGHALGIATISASFDVESVASASVMGVGYGNFGGAYRNGVLALATTDDKPVIRLAPWTGVLNAVNQPVGTAANPRDLMPQEEDAFAIELDVVNP